MNHSFLSNKQHVFFNFCQKQRFESSTRSLWSLNYVRISLDLVKTHNEQFYPTKGLISQGQVFHSFAGPPRESPKSEQNITMQIIITIKHHKTLFKKQNHSTPPKKITYEMAFSRCFLYQVTMPRDAVHPHGMVEHRDVHNMCPRQTPRNRGKRTERTERTVGWSVVDTF